MSHQPSKSNEEIVATALIPLIKQIFHGDNHTSEAIHKEMDRTIKSLADTLTAKDAQRERAVEEGFNNGYTKALREIDIGSHDYLQTRRMIADISGKPMMALTVAEHLDVIRQALTPPEVTSNQSPTGDVK